MLYTRLRAGLKKIGGDLDENAIITTASGYQLNPEMEVELDTEEFEKLVLKGKSEKKLSLLEQACDMYHGDFMEGSREKNGCLWTEGTILLSLHSYVMLWQSTS